MEIQVADKFEPLFELLNENAYKEVDTVILTGGRASSKSFSVALFTLYGVVEHGWKVLYSRFTNTSIGDSIKEEVSSKIELMGYENILIDNQREIYSKDGEGRISFKGIKTGSKGQTANLKSLSGFNVFVVDEAEEIPNYEVFKKVFYSIRSADKRNISILILNPTVRTHWIYRHYWAKNNVKDGFCGVIDNVMYIHSSYLDVNPDYIPKNIRKDYERLLIDDPKEYDNIVMGGWKKQREGVLYGDNDLKYYEELPKDAKLELILSFVDIADSGTDYHSAPIGYLYDNGIIYIEDVVFTQQPTDINVGLTAQKLVQHKVDYARVETNFGGGMYMQLLKPELNKVKSDNKVSILPAKATTNKHARILLAQYIIKNQVRFKAEHLQDSEYSAFMNNIFEYMLDESHDHDDALDSLEGLVQLARSMRPSIMSKPND